MKIRLSLPRKKRESVIEPPAPDAVPGPALELVAFAADCTVAARVRLDAERLSDSLNQRSSYAVSEALIQSLDDGRSLEVAEVELERDELLIVQITGPRGNRERRVRTTPHPIELQVGPYRVDGYLHVRPGIDPLRSFPRRREELVPMTDASVTYMSGGQVARHRFGAIAVNRTWVEWIAVATDQRRPLEGPTMPASTGPLVKDFTGHVVGERSP